MSSFDREQEQEQEQEQEHKLNRRLAVIGVATTASIVGLGTLNTRALAQDATAEAEGGPGLSPLPEGATVVVADLFFPHGIAFDAEGNLFVAVNSIISAPDAPAGQVIRIDGIAA